jgi:GDP-mannose transporter
MFFDQAYGEVFWFGGRVTTLTFIAFMFMVIFSTSHKRYIRLTDGKVLSSIIAAWSDLTNAFPDSISVIDSATNINLQAIQGSLQGLGIGYIWMFCNCVTSAAYVS